MNTVDIIREGIIDLVSLASLVGFMVMIAVWAAIASAPVPV